MKYLAILTFITTLLFSSQVEMLSWREGTAFLQFLQDMGLPDSLYYNADNDDKKAIEDIQARSTYYILRDENQSILQVLIPLSEELQAHIYRSRGQYYLENIPIEYGEVDKKFVTKITSSSVYNDIKGVTNSGYVASFFVKTLKNRINFRQDIHKGSIVSMLYKRKFRLGYPFGAIDLKLALLETGNRKKYVVNFDSQNYNRDGETVQRNELIRPVKEGTFRVSSRFTKKRWHPILKKYRAHLGIDYAAKKGTPIYSTGDGKVIYVGVSRGYGNLIKIRHRAGYVSLYAHLNSFRKGLRIGQSVKRGEFIGRIGSTGLSTGPHLHFGLYKDGIALDPEDVVSIETKGSIEKSRKKEFIEYRNQLLEQLDILVTDFKSGRYTTAPYSYDRLKCETLLTNVEVKKQRLQHKRAKTIDSNIQQEIDSRVQELRLYLPPDSDKFELSDDYLEYQ